MAENKQKDRTSDNSGRKVQRIQLDLPPQYITRLNELKEDLGAASYVEVVKESLRLLTAVNRLDKKYGLDELIAKKNDGSELTIFYVGK